MRCGGTLTRAHDNKDVHPYKLAPLGVVRHLCEPCRAFAQRVGMDPQRVAS